MMKKRIAVGVAAMIAGGLLATAGAAPPGHDPLSNILEKLDQVLAAVGHLPSWDQTLPSSTRFIVLSTMNGDAVLDRETGLVWEKSPDSEQKPSLDNHRRCNDLNLGHRKGWRVPTIQELTSGGQGAMPPARLSKTPIPGVSDRGRSPRSMRRRPS
jgi:hypothetical protein